MSLSIAIALIVLADIALIAGLAFVMSRATRLTPHVAGSDRVAIATIETFSAAHRARRVSSPRARRSSTPVPAAS